MLAEPATASYIMDGCQFTTNAGGAASYTQRRNRWRTGDDAAAATVEPRRRAGPADIEGARSRSHEPATTLTKLGTSRGVRGLASVTQKIQWVGDVEFKTKHNLQIFQKPILPNISQIF